MNGHYPCSGEGLLFGDVVEETREKAAQDELYRGLVHVKEHPNGGATVVHVYQEEVDRLPSAQVPALANVFFRYKYPPPPTTLVPLPLSHWPSRC